MLTIALGVLFSFIQAYEYLHAPFDFGGNTEERLEEYERLIHRYERSSGEAYSDNTRIGVVLRNMPKGPLQQHLILSAERLKSWPALREEIVETVNEPGEVDARDVLAGVTRPRPFSSTTLWPTSAPAHHPRTCLSSNQAKRQQLRWARWAARARKSPWNDRTSPATFQTESDFLRVPCDRHASGSSRRGDELRAGPAGPAPRQAHDARAAAMARSTSPT